MVAKVAMDRILLLRTSLSNRHNFLFFNSYLQKEHTKLYQQCNINDDSFATMDTQMHKESW